MDENYLDNLLNEITLDNEIEQSALAAAVKQSNSENVQADAIDHMVNEDSDTKLSSEDDIFGESQLNELDELDQMADIDLSELDFADLDFDDLDLFQTSPDTESKVKRSAPNTSMQSDISEDIVPEINLDDLAIDDMFFEETQEETVPEEHTSSDAQKADETLHSADLKTQDNVPEPENTPAAENTDLDDLLEMLGMEDEAALGQESASVKEMESEDEGEDDFVALEDDANQFLNETDLSEEEAIDAKPKWSFIQFLFGAEEDDEPELSDEELEAIMAEKKAKKEAKRAEKDTKKNEKKSKKAAKDAAIQADKAAKKAIRDAERKAMLEAAPPDKKLNRKAVCVIAIFFAVVAGVIVIGTNSFNYKLVIQKASDYFDRQKYHMAYDEIAGVDVKDEDKELKSKIYTVMYVERLYETYEINAKLNRKDKALDALLRGLEKYDEHYEEAQELNIVSDIDSSRSKIVTALLSDYGLTEDDAYAILEMDSYSYRAKLAEYAVATDEDTVISLDQPATDEN